MQGAAGADAHTALLALAQDGTIKLLPAASAIRSNVSSFRMLEWPNCFDASRGGAILIDITSRALRYWSQDHSINRLYPTSVPPSEDLTRRDKPVVVQKVVDPAWRPTASMK